MAKTPKIYDLGGDWAAVMRYRPNGGNTLTIVNDVILERVVLNEESIAKLRAIFRCGEVDDDPR